ncbi:MAG: GNAT family N-acetyltransferase [Flavobacterium sp.]|nr:GNAT family N-acetyltransferase [Flavobacterium sp.]
MSKQPFIINPLIESDANQLHQFIVDNSERLKKYFPVTLSSNETLEKTLEYIAIKNKEIAGKTNFTFAIRNENNHQIVGLIILKKIDWDKNQGEFAYCIDSEFEGKGLSSLAVKEMVKFAFKELKLKTIQIIVHKDNIGSTKVAQKCNFIWQKTLLNEYTPPNESPLDMELYELYNER